jgi:hypothetical protein
MNRFNTYTTTKLAGVSYGGAQANMRRFARKDIPLELRRERHNPHDPNAIKVMVADCFLGYIPKSLAAKLAPAMDAGKQYEASFVCQNRSSYHDLVGLTIRITEIGDGEDAYNRLFR